MNQVCGLPRTMVNPFRHPSAIKFLIAECKNGHCPSAKDIQELCYALHSAMVDIDAPELLWLDHSFEDQGDSYTRAMECAA